MILVGVTAILVSIAVAGAVWSSTGDLWATAQVSVGTIVLMGSMAMALDVLGRLGQARAPRDDDQLAPATPSPAWFIAGFSVGDGSERHVRTRTLPGAYELARRLLAQRHGLDITDPAAEADVRRLLGDEAWELLSPDQGGLGTSRRQTRARLVVLVEGLERL